MSSSAPRILIAGDVYGRLSALFKRVAAVNKSNGPFDVLLCVGQFFPLDPSGIEEVQEYVEGAKKVPLPTYFTGDYGEGARLILSESKANADRAGLNGDEIRVCENLVWLKGGGVVNIHGLRIAYLGGKYSAALYTDKKGASAAGAYHEDDVDVLRAFGDDKAVTDFFLSNEWPQGVTLGVDQAGVPPGVDRSTGTAVAAELAAVLKPRYHIAGTEGVFYARDPYLNPGAVHSTRFIGLAAVGNDKKRKFLHALSPTPAAALSSADLAVRPPNLTASPYELAAAVAEKRNGGAGRVSNGVKKEVLGTGPSEEAEGQYWRYDTSRAKRQKQDDKDRVCLEFVTKGTCSREGNCRFRHELEDGTPIPKGVCFEFLTKGKCEKGADCRFRHSLDKPVPPAPTGPCWFCLSSPDVSTHLVISVGEQCYCALAKGAMMQGHVLLLPIEHFPSTVSLPDDTVAEMEKYKRALRECYEDQGNTIIVFERYLQLRAGTHAHLQVFPIPLLKSVGARNAFVAAARNEGFKFQEIPPMHDFMEARQAMKHIVKGQNYFYVQLPDNAILVHPLEAGAKMSMQFGREVIAIILGQKGRADWKACTQSKDDEIVMAEEFKQQFLKFDPMC